MKFYCYFEIQIKTYRETLPDNYSDSKLIK